MMKLRSLDFKHIIGELLVVLFSVVYALVKASNAEDGRYNIYIASFGLLCFAFYLIMGNRRILVQSIIVGVAASLFMIISILYNDNAKIEYLLWIWCYMGVALVFNEYRLSNLSAFFICYFIEILFLSKALMWGSSSDYSGAEMFIEGNNSISVLCLYASSIFYITKYLNNHKASLSYIPVLLMIFLSTLYANRGGILAGGILFLFIFYFNMKISSSKFKNYLIFLIIAIAVYYVFKIGYDTFGAGMQYKLEHIGGESSRTEVWGEYIGACFDNFLNLFLGVPCFDGAYPVIKNVSGNIHNSFLILHSKFGLIPFIWMMVVQVKCIRYLKKIKCVALAYCLISIYARSFFDWAAFPGIFDVFFWYTWIILITKNSFRNNFENYEYGQISNMGSR